MTLYSAVEAFAKTLPVGAINFVSGGGRTTMPPLMETGDIDGLAFIGGSAAADKLIQQHPHPHRLKIFLQLEAKNMGVSRVWSVYMQCDFPHLLDDAHIFSRVS
jgi:acyl-CoA reductase-like NAD-dependent aldehyde dehydrogenase